MGYRRRAYRSASGPLEPAWLLTAQEHPCWRMISLSSSSKSPGSPSDNRTRPQLAGLSRTIATEFSISSRRSVRLSLPRMAWRCVCAPKRIRAGCMRGPAPRSWAEYTFLFRTQAAWQAGQCAASQFSTSWIAVFLCRGLRAAVQASTTGAAGDGRTETARLPRPTWC